MDVFSTPDKIPARPVLKEIHSNDIMNNKSPASRNAVDEPNGSLDQFAKTTPNTSSKSFIVPETPIDKNGQVNKADTTCDDLIRNINELALNTPKCPPSTNALIENCNSPSSDDEVFEECENSFGGTPNAKIVSESGYRTANYSNDTFDATINFPANIANSTVTSTAVNLTDRFRFMPKNFNGSLDATKEVSEIEQVGESLPAESSVDTLDRTIQISNVDSIENSHASVNTLDVIRPAEAEQPSNSAEKANATLTIESVDDIPANDVDVAVIGSVEQNGSVGVPDVLHGTANMTAPLNVTEIHDEVADILAQSKQIIENVERIEAIVMSPKEIKSDEIGVSDSVEQLPVDPQHEAPTDDLPATNFDSQDSVANDPQSMQTIIDKMQSLIEATDNDSPAAVVTEKAEVVEEVHEVIENEAGAANEELPEAEKVEGATKTVQTADANSTIHIANEMNEVPMDIDETFTETDTADPMDISMAPMQVDDEQLPPSTALLDETQLLASPEVAKIGRQSTLSDESNSSAANTIATIRTNGTITVKSNDKLFEPNGTIVLDAHVEKTAGEIRLCGDETFCAPGNGEEPQHPRANLDETILIASKLPNPNTTFFAQPSLDAVDETLNPATNAVNEATFHIKSEPKRTSFELDASVAGLLANNDQTVNLLNTSPLVGNGDVVFKVPTAPISSSNNGEAKLPSHKTFDVSDDEFQTGGMILNPSDFEFLLSKGETPKDLRRDSILERFDPLSRKSVLHSIPIGSRLPQTREVNCQPQVQQLLEPSPPPAFVVKPQPPKLEATVEVVESPTPTNATILKLESPELSFEKNCAATDSPTSSSSDTYVTASLENIKSNSGNAKMSVGLIHDMNNENMKSMEQVDIHDESNLKMNDEKIVKHDFVEDIQRKLKESEAREESLIRRITEKDKAMNKMSAVMENYEKTMVEMITEREQTTQNYEKQMIQLKAECDANFHHLTSLENTFSDLHAKYEKSKQLTLEVKENETKLLEKLEFAQQQMKLQEQRYDKLKNHAFTQLESANAKLEALTKGHSNDIKKLSAQLKKEEVSRQSIMEQLAQKTKENEELVKICDELINNGPDGS